MTETVKRIAVMLSSLMLVLGLAWAQDAGFDTAFAQAAAQGDMYEISSSERIVEAGGNEEVVAFAQRMIEDHTMTTEQLTSLAQSAGIELPTAPAPTHEAKLAQLAALEGADLETAYVQQQVIVHQDAVSLFRAASTMAQNEELRAFAEQTLPALEEHLQMAQDLAQGAP